MIEAVTTAGALILLAALLAFVWNVAGELFEVPEGLPFWRETAWRYGAMMARFPYVPAGIVLLSPILALQYVAYKSGYSGWIEMARAWLTAS